MSQADFGYDDFEEDGDSITAWVLNFILGLLGTTVVGLAFLTLDRDDPRYLHNPWTYVIVVPVALALISAVLNTLVSRVVRRSMQAAFLLSVVAHLLILAYFGNIVIHSRYWPQLFDSFAQQRQQLKRESLQARQYVKISSKTQPKIRPDYLRPLPTQHEATELPETPTHDNQSDLSDLRPAPDATDIKRDSAHALARAASSSQPSPTRPESADLSRSNLSPAQPESRTNPTYEIFRSEPELQAAESAASRAPTNRQTKSVVQPAAPQFDAPADRTPLDASAPQRRSTNSSPQLRLDQLADLPRHNPAADTPTSISRIETLAAQPSQSSAPSLSPASQNVRSTSRSSLTDTATASNLTPAYRTPQLSDSPLKRNDAAARKIPTPSDGDSNLTLARSSVGGEAGPASRSSLPVFGSQNLAAPTASESDLMAASSIQRKSGADQSVTSMQLQNSGQSASPNWDGERSLSSGLAARSPAELALEGSGTANSISDAGLQGSGGELQRAAVGQIGPQGATQISSFESSTGDGESMSPLQADRSELSRNSSSADSVNGTPSLTIASLDGNHSSPAAMSAGLPSDLQQRSSESAARAQNDRPLLSDFAQQSPADARGAGSTQVAAPAESIDGVASDGISGIVADAPLERTRSGNSRLAIPLQVQAVGGDNSSPQVGSDSAGPLLARRSAERELSLPNFEAQPIDRSRIGGELDAGTNVAMPTPAFQQRLDRLQNNAEGSVDPLTEQAIERGLEFLARYQREDGSWRLQDFDTEVLIRSDTAATALAVLAFQGAGYTHVQAKYAAQVNRAIEFLAKHQKKDGDLYIPQDPASDQNAWLYSHAIAALALCEAYGMTQDERLKPVAQQAVNFMVRSQDPRRGGWRYRPTSGSDTSVTGWYTMALQSGRLAGLDVPQSTLDAIDVYASRAQASEEEPYLYRYNPYAPDTIEQRHGLQPTAVMTSVGLLIHLYMGGQRTEKQLIDGATYLLVNSPENGTKAQSRRDTYYWYYATQVIFHMGGDYWKRWHDTLNPMLIQEQVQSGRYVGSWDPNEPVPDIWAKYGGRLYVTTMNLLSLEVSYRHLPLYASAAE